MLFPEIELSVIANQVRRKDIQHLELGSVSCEAWENRLLNQNPFYNLKWDSTRPVPHDSSKSYRRHRTG